MIKKYLKPALALMLLAAVLFTAYQLYARHRAVSAAREYLSAKYGEEMEYKAVRYSWTDPALYHVCFASLKTPEVDFEVLVQNDLSVKADGLDHSADNYVIKLFEHQMEAELLDGVRAVWDDGAHAVVTAVNGGLYAFSIPSAAGSGLSLTEMEALVENYEIAVQTGVCLDEDSIEDAAGMIYAFLQEINGRHFTPETVRFRFENCKLSLCDWADIDGAERIVRLLEREIVG